MGNLSERTGLPEEERRFQRPFFPGESHDPIQNPFVDGIALDCIGRVLCGREAADATRFGPDGA